MRIPGLESSSDTELVRAFSGGDLQALDVLLRRHESRVYGVACRILGNRADAQDAVQEVFINLFRKAGSFREEAAFSTWLYRLCVNACYDLARKRSRSPDPVEAPEGQVADPTAGVDDRVMIEKALAALPVEQRAVLVMRDLQGASYEEIAEATGSPVGTVKSRIARGRAALAGLLGGAGSA